VRLGNGLARSAVRSSGCVEVTRPAAVSRAPAARAAEIGCSVWGGLPRVGVEEFQPLNDRLFDALVELSHDAVLPIDVPPMAGFIGQLDADAYADQKGDRELLPSVETFIADVVDLVAVYPGGGRPLRRHGSRNCGDIVARACRTRRRGADVEGADRDRRRASVQRRGRTGRPADGAAYGAAPGQLTAWGKSPSRRLRSATFRAAGRANTFEIMTRQTRRDP
jgi:hypothetical protein